MKIYFLCVCLILTACNSEMGDSSDADSTDTKKVVVDKQFKSGQSLFSSYCARCHHSNVVDDMVGPALFGVEGRWEQREDLIRFIQNPQDLINENHPRARKIAELWPSEMTANPSLTSDQIDAILYFVEKKGAKQ